ncbi:MAG: hypothetical protein KDA80_20680, partial [Planctomycetaceae bacterium]|nr:hypothetical protein [Planctomycetaceae bacterium]
MQSLLHSTQAFTLPVVECCTVAVLHGRKWSHSIVNGDLEHALMVAEETHLATGLTVQVLDFEGCVVEQF